MSGSPGWRMSGTGGSGSEQQSIVMSTTPCWLKLSARTPNLYLGLDMGGSKR